MYFLVLAYPELKTADFRMVQDYRRKYDRQYALVKPHFTFVFPCNFNSAEAFIAEIRQAGREIPAIPFSLSSVYVHEEREKEYYEFLVPENGYAEMEALHKRFYAGKLKEQLNRTIKYIPHMTIGHSNDQAVSAGRLKDLLPGKKCIEGKITALSLAGYQDAVLKHIGEIRLH